MKRKDYEKPTMKVVQLQHQMRLLAGSAKLNGWRDSGGDAWDGSSSSGSGSGLGGWTDNGGDAWE